MKKDANSHWGYVSRPYPRIASSSISPFGWNEFSKTFHVTIYHSLPLTSRLGPSRTLHFFHLSQSMVDLLEFFGSLSCCMVHFCFSFKFLDRWPLLQHPLIQWRIYSRSYDGEQARPCCSKAAPNHDIPTPVLHSWYEVLAVIVPEVLVFRNQQTTKLNVWGLN